MRDRSILLAASVLAALLATSGRAAAQTPFGSLRGRVVPASEHRADYTGIRDWTDAELAQGVAARVTLTPLWTYGCRTGRPCAPAVVVARGTGGVFDAGRLHMGRYRVAAKATGCAAWAAEVVVTQHQEAVLNIPLRCAAVPARGGG